MHNLFDLDADRQRLVPQLAEAAAAVATLP